MFSFAGIIGRPSAIVLPAAEYGPYTVTGSTATVGVNRTLTASGPSNIAAADVGDGAGVYKWNALDQLDGPVVLFNGVLSSPPNEGTGTVSIVETPLFAKEGTLTVTYSYWVGGSQIATGTSYSNTQAAGVDIQVRATATDDNGTTTLVMGTITVQENPLGPVLSNLVFNPATSTISFDSDLGGTVAWRRYSPDYVFTNQAADVRAGTGALDGGTFTIVSGSNSAPITFASGNDGVQDLWIVAQNGSGPISNVIGGAVNISADALTTPSLRGTEISGTNTASSTFAASLPAYESGDLVIIGFTFDCAANLVGGVSATGPNGEVAIARAVDGTGGATIVDDGVGGDSGQSVSLLYYRATASYAGGAGLSCSILPGTKSTEQMVIIADVRHNVKASGDPFGSVVRTFSSTTASEMSSGTFTASSAQAKVAFMGAIAFDPVGTVTDPSWTVQESLDVGAPAACLITRGPNTTADESVTAATFPLSVTRTWVGLTYEILPQGVGEIADYYVATTGNNGNDGSFTSPFATIAYAASVASPGETIMVRGGTYTGAVDISGEAGTSGNPITIKAYPGETPIIDGTGTASNTDLFQVGSYMVIEGLHIANSTKFGLTAWEQESVTYRNITAYNCERGGLFIGGAGRNTAGSNHAIEGCVVYNCVLENENNSSGPSGWSSGIIMDMVTTGAITDCYAYENWGEGIRTLGCQGVDITGCYAYDNWSVQIYLDNCQSADITGNFAFSTGNTTFYRSGSPGVSILAANEDYGNDAQIEQATTGLNVTGNTYADDGVTQITAPFYDGSYGDGGGAGTSSFSPNTDGGVFSSSWPLA